jgi:hypothetical protein
MRDTTRFIGAAMIALAVLSCLPQRVAALAAMKAAVQRGAADSTHEESWTSGPNVMCGGYGGFGFYGVAMTIRYRSASDGGQQIVGATAAISSSTFLEHPRTRIAATLEVVQQDRAISRLVLGDAPVQEGSDVRRKVTAAGAAVRVPKGASLRVVVTPDVMIDRSICIEALCNWCSLGASTHAIALR